MARTRASYTLEVVKISHLAQQIVRVTFATAAGGFTKDDEGGYLKLEFAQADGDAKRRSFTIRSVAEDGERLVMDFVNHGDIGYASAWANQVQVGQKLNAFGPGPARLFAPGTKSCILVGDATSLPAIDVALSRLDPSAQGHCLLHIRNGDEIQALQNPEGVSVHYIVEPEQRLASAKILEKLASLPLQGHEFAAWVAGEFDLALQARKYLQAHATITSSYFSSYWKVNASDDDNKKAKKAEGGFS